MTQLEIAKDTTSLDEMAAEGLAAIERAYEDAMAHIASLAEADAAPSEQAPDREPLDAPTVEITAQAA